MFYFFFNEKCEFNSFFKIVNKHTSALFLFVVNTVHIKYTVSYAIFIISIYMYNESPYMVHVYPTKKKTPV